MPYPRRRLDSTYGQNRQSGEYTRDIAARIPRPPYTLERASKDTGVDEDIIDAIALFFSLPEWADMDVDCQYETAGRCCDASYDMQAFLRDYGFRTRIVELWGLAAKSQRYTFHCVLQVEEWFVDCTGAQFGPEYAGVRFLTEEQICEEWRTVTLMRTEEYLDIT